jgi:hypothetical protein
MKNRSYIGIVAVAAKSWTFATVLITRAAERPLRILCTRETMAWIRESVHQLLSDRIYALGLADQFAIGKTSAVPSQPNPACRPEPVTPGWLPCLSSHLHYWLWYDHVAYLRAVETQAGARRTSGDENPNPS